jgi:hypothetical protein
MGTADRVRFTIGRAGVYDQARRRRAVRKGRERGCWVYIPAEELARTRIGVGEAPPFYRTFGRDGGATVVVALYAEE